MESRRQGTQFTIWVKSFFAIPIASKKIVVPNFYGLSYQTHRDGHFKLSITSEVPLNN